ncbi:uncharacterized protein [Epargyreus clarus]|uniref:uncharacterized protein n=1 Tax=Epargyreus clarus TaxID=520877 RepID=UPI003C2EF9D0
MSERPSNTPSQIGNPPTSEVATPETTQDHPAGQNVVIPQTNSDNQMWKLLFEMQQRQMMEMIRTMKESNKKDLKLVFPEFNPESQDSDARAWCATVDLCVQERELSSSNLIIALSKALKGTAAAWLAQNSVAGITWPQMKDSFLARFEYVETPAATLCRLFNENPKDGECLASYANRFLSTLMNRWRSLSNEQIAIAVTLAHASKIEPRLQRLAFTTEIDSRVKLQQELMAYTYRKRGPVSQDKPVNSDAKRSRLDQLRRCYMCNKPGHLAIDCYVKNITSQASMAKNPAEALKKPSPLTCFSCGEQGHVSTRCLKKQNAAIEAVAERRVDVCTIKPASDHLSNDELENSDGIHEDV